MLKNTKQRYICRFSAWQYFCLWRNLYQQASAPAAVAILTSSAWLTAANVTKAAANITFVRHGVSLPLQIMVTETSFDTPLPTHRSVRTSPCSSLCSSSCWEQQADSCRWKTGHRHQRCVTLSPTQRVTAGPEEPTAEAVATAGATPPTRPRMRGQIHPSPFRECNEDEAGDRSNCWHQDRCCPLIPRLTQRRPRCALYCAWETPTATLADGQRLLRPQGPVNESTGFTMLL